MNANELADILQQSDFLAMDFAEDAATMLRQQQAEIESLKKNLDIALMMIDNRNDIIDKLDLK